MASKRASKKNVQPDYTGSLADYKESLKPSASKKEKLFGQELGKIGRAAERGGPVNKVQKEHGEYSTEVMRRKALKDMPIKNKLESFSDILIAGTIANPGTYTGTAALVNKGATALGQKVANTGIPAKLENVVTRQTVMLHGSPTQNLKTIVPTVGENRAYTTERGALGFYENPQVNPSGRLAQIYATNEGSVYAVKGKIKSFKSEENQSIADWVKTSTSPQKVVAEIKLPSVGRNLDERAAAISQMARKAGAKKIPRIK